MELGDWILLFEIIFVVGYLYFIGNRDINNKEN